MRLQIYGDSFGEEQMLKHPRRDLCLRLPSFHNELRHSGAFSSVITYADGGADLWSQYKQFLLHYTGTEAVVLFETQPNRITVNTNRGLFSRTEEYHFVNLSTVEKHLMDSPDNPYIQAALDYFKYIQSDDYDHFANQAILEDIKSRCNNLLIIPCFPDSVSTQDQCLGTVHGSENAHWRYKPSEKWIDLRRNHITTPNHRILAKQIQRHFQEQVEMDFTAFVEPDNRQQYLVKA